VSRGGGFSPARIWAMLIRYLYLLRSSWPRTLELLYWPTVQMLIWGFMSQFLYVNSNYVFRAFGVLLAAVMLWDVLFRGQLGFTFTFLEEIWSRNIANLMMTPLKPAELAASLMLMSLLRLLISTIPVTLLAIVLFAFNIYDLGFGLIAYFINLVLTGWAIALVISGLVLRHGLGAESLAWSVMVLMLPLCCVYYPVSVLPVWLQPAAWCFAPTYVFEGVRAVLIDGVFRADLMLECLLLNLLYLAAAYGAFMLMFGAARRNGALLTMGE
jgi:ABC-2 type transport system permease protein